MYMSLIYKTLCTVKSAQECERVCTVLRNARIAFLCSRAAGNVLTLASDENAPYRISVRRSDYVRANALLRLAILNIYSAQQ